MNEILHLLQDVAVSETVKEAIKGISKKISTSIEKKKETDQTILTISKDTDFNTAIVQLINSMYNWSQHIEFIGIADPVALSTIDLKYYFSYRDENPNIAANSIDISETEIVFESKNILIEGAPGSGKTTTLKRLLGLYFFSDSPIEAYNYPLLIRLRSVEGNYNLFTYICFLLGISVEEKIIESVRTVKKTRRIIIEEDEETKKKRLKEKSKAGSSYFETEEYEEDEKFISDRYHVVGNERVEKFIVNLLEENKVLLFIDGIDELKPSIMEGFRRNINDVAINIKEAKILITSRDGYFQPSSDSFKKLRIRELNIEQQKAIASRWLLDPSAFLEELDKKSYRELANKPLFLNFLILLFKENCANGIQLLPAQSIDVYIQFIELILEKWDGSKNIKGRQSKYSNFNNKKKEKFLSELAFVLTYKIKSKEFKTLDFENAYSHICLNFELPPEEATMVAQEIQSHTGLILKTGYYTYEFSHFALQEFLCANYIVKASMDEHISIYLEQYPQVLALCVGLSSDSSIWLNSLIKRILDFKQLDIRTEVSYQLLNRLLTEQPIFKYDLRLATSLLKLSASIDFSRNNMREVYLNIIKSNTSIEKAVIQVLSYYKRKEGSLNLWGRIRCVLHENFDLDFPIELHILDDEYLLQHIKQ
jgi:predicted NACHT family NTPase